MGWKCFLLSINSSLVMDWILKEAESCFIKFPYSIRKPSFLVLDKGQFEYYLKGSPLSLSIANTPSFVAHLPDKELVCLCSEIINAMTKGKPLPYKKKFIRAITMHELFHIKNMHFALTENEALHSEEEVHYQLRREFPELAMILEHFRK